MIPWGRCDTCKKVTMLLSLGERGPNIPEYCWRHCTGMKRNPMTGNNVYSWSVCQSASSYNPPCGYCGGPTDDSGVCPSCSGSNTCTNVDPPTPECDACRLGDGTTAHTCGETVTPVPFDGCESCNKEWTWSSYTKRWWCKECGAYKREVASE